MNPAAVFAMIAWNAVCLLSLSRSRSRFAHGPSYHEFERLFKFATRIVSSSVTIACDREIEAAGGRASSTT